MIKFTEIINTNKRIYITEKGVEEMNKSNLLFKLLTHFDIDPGLVHEAKDTEFFHLVLNLAIWVDEKLISVGEKIPLAIFFQREQKTLGSFGDIKELEDYINDMVKNGLINY